RRSHVRRRREAVADLRAELPRVGVARVDLARNERGIDSDVDVERGRRRLEQERPVLEPVDLEGAARGDPPERRLLVLADELADADHDAGAALRHILAAPAETMDPHDRESRLVPL